MTLTIIQYFWCYNEPYPPTDYTVNTIWSIIYQSQTLPSPFSGNCVPLNEGIMTWCFSRKFSGTTQHLFLSFIDVPSQRAQNLDLLSAYQSVCSVLTWVITHSKHHRLDFFLADFPINVKYFPAIYKDCTIKVYTSAWDSCSENGFIL